MIKQIFKNSVFITFLISTLAGCGSESNQTTPVNLSGLQAISGPGSIFEKGLILYVRNKDQPWMKMAKNMSSSDGLVLPNGRYEMVAMGLVQDASTSNLLTAKCAQATMNGNKIITLDGGEIALDMQFSQENCTSDIDMPFGATEWTNVGTGSNKPLSIKACSGSLDTYGVCATIGGPQSNSMILTYKTFKIGPQFENSKVGAPVKVCLPFSNTGYSDDIFVPGMDRGDVGSGVQPTNIDLLGSLDCSGTPIASFSWQRGLDFTKRGAADPDLGDILSNDAQLFIDTGSNMLYLRTE